MLDIRFSYEPSPTSAIFVKNMTFFSLSEVIIIFILKTFMQDEIYAKLS